MLTLVLERVPFIPKRLMQAVMVFVRSERRPKKKKRSKAYMLYKMMKMVKE